MKRLTDEELKILFIRTQIPVTRINDTFKILSWNYREENLKVNGAWKKLYDEMKRRGLIKCK